MNNKNTTKNIQKGIFVASKHVDWNPALWGDYHNAEHLYLIYIDGLGNKKVLRGGMLNQDGIQKMLTKEGSRIETQRDTNLNTSYDKYEKNSNFKTRYHKKLNISEDKLEQEWNKMNKIAKIVEYGNIRYQNPIKEPIQNSNSVIRTVLEEAGYDYKRALPNEVKDKVPGYETNLFSKPTLMKDEDIDKYVFPNSTAAKKMYNQREYKSKMDIYQKQIKDISNKKIINKYENQIKQQNLLENAPTQTLLPSKKEEATKNLLEKYVEPELLPRKVEIISPQKAEELKSKSEDLLKLLKANNNPHEDILFKKYADVTEDELKETMRYSGYETQDKVLKNKLDDFVQKTYDYHYGSNPAKLDATGRMIESGVRVPFAKESKFLSTKDNIPMDEAFSKIAEQTSPFGVKSLQKGLNNLSLAESNSTPLTEDNVLGPKTTSRVKEILAKHSLDEVNKNIKIGNFSNMLEENRSKMIDNDTLKKTMTTLRPQDGGLFLQKNINHAGADKPDFERLKEDNDIGEKTTTAFNQIKEENEDKLTTFAKENMETEFEKTKEMEEREKQKQAEEERTKREKEAEEKRQEERQKEEQEKIENAQTSLLTSNSLLK
ncbi:MAG: hypothetical protein ACK5N8_01370 [Alphaproteobacteria bacterium]